MSVNKFVDNLPNDELLNEVHANAKEVDDNYEDVLKEVFAKFPDDLSVLVNDELAYFIFELNDKNSDISGFKNIKDLFSKGIVRALPITYEDFLPVSAAGIFKSNLSEEGSIKTKNSHNSRADLEEALGRKIIDSFDLYQRQQDDSIKAILS